MKILTGSLSSNNHTAAHSHYRKYRRQILAAGVALYEFRHDPAEAVRSISDTPPVRSDFISLHTKALVADRRQCFIGPLNLDPRAIEINTENGLHIESPEFCGDLAEHHDALMHPDNTWRLYLDRHDRIAWRSSAGIAAVQPARNVWQRVVDFFFRLLPIESQL